MAELTNIPQDVPITVKAGATFAFAGVFNISLTGQEVRLRISPECGVDPFLVLSTATTGIVFSTTTLANDTVTVTFTPDQLGFDLPDKVPVGLHTYDFERQAGSIVFPIMSGSFEVKCQV